MKIHKIAIVTMMVLICQIGYGQVTSADNLPTGGNYVGFNNTSGIALPIRNQGFPDINISSNSSNKFAITELGTWNGLNGLSRNRVPTNHFRLTGTNKPRLVYASPVG